jgi:hypothetical protein
MVIVSQVRDANAFEQGIATIGGAAFAVDRITIHDTKVLVLNLYYFALHIAILDKEVIATTNSQLLKDALENWATPGPSIVDTPQYKSVDAHRLNDACFELYMPPGGFSRGIYDYYIPMLQQVLWLAGSPMLSGNRNVSPESRGLHPSLFPRGAGFIAHSTKPTFLTASDDGNGVLFDGCAPILCTPYYWAYVHALGRLRPPEVGWTDIIKYLTKPVEAEDQ